MKTVVKTYLTVADTRRVLIKDFSDCTSAEKAFHLRYGGGLILIHDEIREFRLELAGMSHTFYAIFLDGIPPLCKGDNFSREFFEKTGHYITMEPKQDSVVLSEYRFEIDPIPPAVPLQKAEFSKKDFICSMYEAIKEFTDFLKQFRSNDLHYLEKRFELAEEAMKSIGIEV